MTVPPALTLYHGDGTRSVRVRWLLEELNLPYTLQKILFPPRVRQPEYLAHNPAGSLPLLIDGKVKMTESMGICTYLAEKGGGADFIVRASEPGYAEYLQFCWYGEATLVQPVGMLVQYVMLLSPELRPARVVQDARASLALRLEPVAAALAHSSYLAGDRFTLADISVGYALDLAAFMEQEALFSDSIRDYRRRLAERPAYQRAHYVGDA